MLVSTHYMDEAERCHEIAYIAYGELLAQGTIDEVIAQSHLRTYTVSGPDLQSLAEKLTGIAGIDMVAPFGNSLHVAGRDADALERAVAAIPRLAPTCTGASSQPSLEDVFISLMGARAGQLPMIDLDGIARARRRRLAHGRPCSSRSSCSCGATG